MADTALPVNPNYIFVPAPVTLGKLTAILAGIESNAADHPVDPTYPTNSWVTHVYKAVVQNPPAEGYVVLYDIPPVGNTGNTPVQVAPVQGADDKAKADNASLLVGRGNGLIGYEDFDGPQRAVIFRKASGVIPGASVPGGLSWDNNPQRVAWSNQLLTLVGQNIAVLQAGNPEGFISGYDTLSTALKTKFWAELLVAVSKFESDWDPTNVFHEPPPLGVNSIGLLQLSKKDQGGYAVTPQITDENDLKQPLLNLGWGVTIFAHLVAQDSVVARGSGKPGDAAKGAARYWSVLRAGHKIDLIKALTKKNVGL